MSRYAKRLNDMKLNINIPDHQQSTEIVKDNKGNTKRNYKFLLSCEVKRLSTNYIFNVVY